MSPKIKEKRAKPKCALCRNHGKLVDKAGHDPKDCEYEKDHLCESPFCKNPAKDHPCELCEFTKIRREKGREEIKRKRKLDEAFPEEAEGSDQPPGKLRKEQQCRVCRNHKKFVAKSGKHKFECKNKNCQCKLCCGTAMLQKATRSENLNTRRAKEGVALTEAQDDDVLPGPLSIDSGYDTVSNDGYSLTCSPNESDIAMEPVTPTPEEIIQDNIMLQDLIDFLPAYILEQPEHQRMSFESENFSSESLIPELIDLFPNVSTLEGYSFYYCLNERDMAIEPVAPTPEEIIQENIMLQDLTDFLPAYILEQPEHLRMPFDGGNFPSECLMPEPFDLFSNEFELFDENAILNNIAMM